MIKRLCEHSLERFWTGGGNIPSFGVIAPDVQFFAFRDHGLKQHQILLGAGDSGIHWITSSAYSACILTLIRARDKRK